MSIDWRLVVFAVMLWLVMRYGVGPKRAESGKVLHPDFQHQPLARTG